MLKKIRNVASSRLGACTGAILGLLLMAMLTMAQVPVKPKQGECEQKPVQGQQVCPCPTAQSQCQVHIDCPPVKAPGKTVCQATIDCPPAKGEEEKKEK